MTYLQAVNQVLIRLRENQVSTVTQTAYSTLIGQFVNDFKRQVEDAWTWVALDTTLTVTTTPGTSEYVVTGSGRRFKDNSVNDITNQARLSNVPSRWIEDQQQLTNVQNGDPIYYAWSGWDGTDSKVLLYPTPDGTYTLKFNLCAAQATLTNDSDVILVPEEPIILGAYARALAERGEDGSLNSSEAFGLYKSSLSDWIALESSRQDENSSWSVV